MQPQILSIEPSIFDVQADQHEGQYERSGIKTVECTAILEGGIEINFNATARIYGRISAFDEEPDFEVYSSSIEISDLIVFHDGEEISAAPYEYLYEELPNHFHL